jgi:pimeloyl-ACP methyl ester carboxylesterase
MPRLRTVLLVGAAAAVGAAVATERRWRRVEAEADLLVVPEGTDHKVESTDGAVLAVTDVGPTEGATVVLTHCWMGSRGMWAGVTRRLVENGHRVVLYDQRGHGESTVGPAGCTIEALADDLAAVLEHRDVRDAVVAGHSLGGMTIQAFATAHPQVADDRVERFVLVATASGGLARQNLGGAAGAVLAAPVTDRVLSSPVGHALVRSALGREVAHGHLVATRDLLVATEPSVRRDFLDSIVAMDLTPGLAEVTVPTTVVAGARDRLTPVRLSRQIAEAVPGAELVVLDDAGHQLPLERPDDLADLIAVRSDS